MKSIRIYFFTLKLRIFFSFFKDEEKKYLDTPDLKLMRKNFFKKNVWAGEKQ